MDSFFRTICGVAALALSATFAAPASASVIYVTYTGTVSSGYDFTGEFGTADADLTGDAFMARFIFDDSRGYIESDGVSYSLNYGGASYSIASPGQATVIINGHSFEIGGTYSSHQYREENYQEHEVTDITYSYEDDYYVENYVLFDGGMQTPAGFEYYRPLSYDYSPGEVFGFLQIYAASDDDDYSDDAGYHFAQAYLSADSVKVVSSIPEPSVWTMMLLGFAGVFTMQRHRRTSTIVAAQSAEIGQ